MGIKSDIQIAQENKMQEIKDVAKKAGIDEKHLEYYGRYKAKIDYGLFDEDKNSPKGKLVLVTAITPTPAGEGKTNIRLFKLPIQLCRYRNPRKSS